MRNDPNMFPDVNLSKYNLELSIWVFYAETLSKCHKIYTMASNPHIVYSVSDPMCTITTCMQNLMQAYKFEKVDLKIISKQTWHILTLGCYNACFLIGVMMETISLIARSVAIKERPCALDESMIGDIMNACENIKILIQLNEIRDILQIESIMKAAIQVCTMAFCPENTIGLIPVVIDLRREIRSKIQFPIELKLSIQSLVESLLIPHKLVIKDYTTIMETVKNWVNIKT